MEIFWRTIAYYNSATWLLQIVIILIGIVLPLLHPLAAFHKFRGTLLWNSYYSYWYRADSIAHLPATSVGENGNEVLHDRVVFMDFSYLLLYLL